jgi:hypothetical protein
VLNPHWHGASWSDRCWYVVGWLMGLGIGLGLLLVVDYVQLQRWLARQRVSLAGVGIRLRRA